MNLRELLLEKIERTGKADTAVIGWGRGMGHKGHMYLASSVITHAKELGADPYFVVSRTFGPDDPLKPEEKLAIYRKVFPEQGHIFQTASDELPDLTRVLTNLNQQGYRNAVVVVGADQVKAFQYLNNYNGKPNKAGEIPFQFDDLQVISRQMTSDPSREQEGPRATPMRQVLLDPTKSEEEQFAVWRDAMSDNIPDDEVRNLMMKAKERMMTMKPEPKKAPAKKKAAEPAVAEADKHSFIGRIQRHQELKKKVDQTWKDAADAEKRGDKKGADRAFNKHVRYTNLERPGTWRDVKDESVAENTKPGWMLKKDPELAKKVKQKTDLAKKRQQSYGDPSKGVSKNEDRDVIGSMVKSLENPPKVMQHRAKRDIERWKQYDNSQKRRDDDKKDQWGDLKTEVSDEMIKRYFSGAMKDTISGKKDRNKGMTRAMSRMSGTNKPL